MRSQSVVKSQEYRPSPPAALSHRYVVMGVLLVMVSCTASQPPASFTPMLVSGPARGFQVQIHSTRDKASADQMLNAAEAWWQSMEEGARQSLFGVAYLPVEIKWLDPHYRVRIGHFRSREEARDVLNEVVKKFPAALIVPDTIL